MKANATMRSAGSDSPATPGRARSPSRERRPRSPRGAGRAGRSWRRAPAQARLGRGEVAVCLPHAERRQVRRQERHRREERDLAATLGPERAGHDQDAEQREDGRSELRAVRECRRAREAGRLGRGTFGRRKPDYHRRVDRRDDAGSAAAPLREHELLQETVSSRRGRSYGPETGSHPRLDRRGGLPRVHSLMAMTLDYEARLRRSRRVGPRRVDPGPALPALAHRAGDGPAGGRDVRRCRSRGLVVPERSSWSRPSSCAAARGSASGRRSSPPAPTSAGRSRGIWTESTDGTKFLLQSLAISLVFMTAFASMITTVAELRVVLYVLSFSAALIGGLSVIAFGGNLEIPYLPLLQAGRSQGGVGDPRLLRRHAAHLRAARPRLASEERRPFLRIALYCSVLTLLASAFTSPSRGAYLGTVVLGILFATPPWPERLFRSRRRRPWRSSSSR